MRNGLLVDIDGDRATVDAQFMVFSILGDAKPASGWPAGAVGAMGTITPIESGYYNQRLVRVDGQWLDAVTAIALGYPHDLDRSPQQGAVMTGGRFNQIDYPTQVVR
jgi:hypothetical protein